MSKFKSYIIEGNIGTICNVEGVNNKALLSLVDYMVSKGMRVKPLPKIKVISDDKANATDIFGDTAGYDLDTHTITLFTKDRTEEDVARSFCHEMIHHIQNLEDRLIHQPTQNVNKDSQLEQLEAEAYRRGGMIFRAWKDEQMGRE